MPLQALDVGGAAVDIDVKAVRRVAYHAHIRPERIEDGLGDRGSGAIRAVKPHLDTLEREVGAGDEGGYIAVAALHVVHRSTKIGRASCRERV